MAMKLERARISNAIEALEALRVPVDAEPPTDAVEILRRRYKRAATRDFPVPKRKPQWTPEMRAAAKRRMRKYWKQRKAE